MAATDFRFKNPTKAEKVELKDLKDMNDKSINGLRKIKWSFLLVLSMK